MREMTVTSPGRELLIEILDSDERIGYIGVAEPVHERMYGGESVRAEVMSNFARIFGARFKRNAETPRLTEEGTLYSERTFGWCTYGRGTDIYEEHTGTPETVPGSGILSVAQKE